MRLLFAALLAGATVCTRIAEPPSPVLPFAADTHRVERVARGVTHRYVYAPAGPWAINVLDVNRAACYSAVAVKGFPGAAGRKKAVPFGVFLALGGIVGVLAGPELIDVYETNFLD